LGFIICGSNFSLPGNEKGNIVGVGHVAVAIGAAKAAPRVNAGWLVFAALLADFLLGVFAYFGLEHATVPVDYASRHYLLFTFPYSHGLLPLVIWGILLGLLISWPHRTTRQRVFLVIAALVVSHFVLDGLVHVSGLPLAGENSPKFGLGLWRNMPLELTIETLMTLAGAILFWKAASRSAVSRYGVILVTLVVLALTWTQLTNVTPPDPRQVAASCLVFPLVLSALVYSLDWKRVHPDLVG
jgi:hypothetical protein